MNRPNPWRGRQGNSGSAVQSRALPSREEVGLADVRLLPDDTLASAWSAIFLPEGEKDRIARTTAAGFVLRRGIEFERLPLHGIVLLVGPPGTGKTTLARGLGDRLARMLKDLGPFAYIEINPHALASSSLGRSQQAVEQLFATTISETAAGGPLVVLIDEVETIVTDRARMSFEANPADVHRAVDAALVGLDHVARAHREVLFLATSNFPEAIDSALMSRADFVVNVDLPSLAARRAILEDTIQALSHTYPNVSRLIEPSLLDRAARAAEGLDARRLRKVFVTAAGRSEASTTDPGQMTPEELLSAIDEVVSGKVS